jgi:uncharacterized protein YpiB (UPF0302 family)
MKKFRFKEGDPVEVADEQSKLYKKTGRISKGTAMEETYIVQMDENQRYEALKSEQLKQHVDEQSLDMLIDLSLDIKNKELFNEWSQQKKPR